MDNECKYTVHIDGEQVLAFDRLFKAAWAADKLCQLLPFVREVSVMEYHKIKVRWQRLPATPFGWIDTHKD